MEDYSTEIRQEKEELRLRMQELMYKYQGKHLSNTEMEAYASQFADAIEMYVERMHSIQRAIDMKIDSDKDY